jgi:pyruvate dehydrogenase E2 component (dihydrolipoamide acetyltransferase)
MMVNVTCDHRVIYGAHAAAFLQDLATLIETNAQSLTL